MVQEAAGNTLEALLAPGSVAVIGASGDATAPGGRLLKVLRQFPYKGRVYGVNPKTPDLGDGIEVRASVRELPEAPDLCLIVVAAERAPQAIRDCCTSGARSAVVYSAPPASSTVARDLDDAIVVARRDYGLQVVGPNCVGFLNLGHSLAATWSPAVDTDNEGPRPMDGPVAIVAQSGGLAFGLLREANDRGLGVRFVISTGNEADLDCEAFASAFLDDPHISVVMMFIEGLNRPDAFLRICGDARQRGKTLVVGKVGRSVAAREAAELHTAHLTGNDAAYEALFQEFGVLRARDAEHMVDLAMALVGGVSATGSAVGVATVSGGSGVWLADAVADAGLTVPALPVRVASEVKEATKTAGSVRNPIDVTGPAITSESLGRAAVGLLTSGCVDAVAAVMPALRDVDVSATTHVLALARAETGRPVVVFSYMGASSLSKSVFAENRIPWYPTPTRAAEALRALAHSGSTGTRDPARLAFLRSSAADETPLDTSGAELDEFQAKQVLTRYGVPVSSDIMVKTRRDAVDAARSIGTRVALKAQVPGVIHKAKLGLVFLDVGPDDVGATYDVLMERVRLGGLTEPSGILVSEMVTAGLEMIVGTIADHEFGPLLMIGIGGTDAELINDRIVRLAPIDANGVEMAIRQLRSYDVIRSHVESGFGQLAELAARASEAAWALRSEISGIDMNPVIVNRLTGAAVVVDASATRV